MQVSNVNSKASVERQASFQRNIAKPQKHRESNNKVKLASIAGSSVGIAVTLATLLSKAKKGNPATTFRSLSYEEPEMIKLGLASVVGGMAGGIAADNKKNSKAKVKEAIQQALGNIITPVGLLAINTRLLEKSGLKFPIIKGNNKFVKFANQSLGALPRVVVTIASLVAGMKIGHTIVDKLNEKIFHEKEKRQIKASDYSAHVDDLCLVSSLMLKDSAVKTVTSKMIPLSMMISGFEAGTKQEEHSVKKFSKNGVA